MKTLYVAFHHGDTLGYRVKHTFLDGFGKPKSKAEFKAMIKAIAIEMRGGPVTPISWHELED